MYVMAKPTLPAQGGPEEVGPGPTTAGSPGQANPPEWSALSAPSPLEVPKNETVNIHRKGQFCGEIQGSAPGFQEAGDEKVPC